MQDEYLRGSVSRICQEAPVPVISIASTEIRQGGAANVANNIEAMGVPVERIFGGGQRIRKIRLLTKTQQVYRVDFDYPQSPIPCDSAYREALERCQIVVLIDYGKGSLANVQELIREAKALQKAVFIDPKGFDYSKYRGATLIKPNREEMKELVGGWSSQDELDFKARQFLLASGIDSILLTQAEEGLTFYTKDSTTHYPSEAKEIVDVSGAGEAALSAFTAAIAKGFKSTEAAGFAIKASAVAIAHFGTTILEEKDVFGAEDSSSG
jgi:D-glycero-beta-D-manno-heptose-7-phosphate kinase